MYAVVGCSECDMLWVVEGRPERSQCPRCGTRRQHAKRRKFLTTDDADQAREARAAMLAERQGHAEDFADLDSFTEMESRVDDAGPDDVEYLAGSGVDPDAVADAGERAGEPRSGQSRSRNETIRAALRELDEPTEADVVAYASEYGVSEECVRRALTKLVRAGEVTRSGGVYRLL